MHIGRPSRPPDVQPPTGGRAHNGDLPFGEPNAALALVFAIGAAQGLVIMALPHWHTDHPAVVVALASLAGATSGLIVLARHWMTSTQRHAALIGGMIATSVAVWACGRDASTMSVGYAYVLIILYASTYYSAPIAVLYLAAVASSYGCALAFVPAPATPVQLLQATATFAVITILVTGFARRLRQSSEQRLADLEHDSLTGLGNRTLLLERLDSCGQRPLAERNSIGVMAVNLDNFRVLSACIGERLGDDVIREVADRIRGAVRDSDLTVRLGGDDFAVLVDGGPMPDTAVDIAKRISAAIEAPMSLGESDVHLYASIGIATGLSSSPAVLLRDADLALYVAKTNGKHRVEVVAPEMRTSATQQLALAAGLRQALQRRELEVYYQPIVDARDGAPRGAEALLRWRHPTRGIVAPTEFIPVAESEEMIREIGESVLHRACRQAADWRRRHVVDDSFTISVNVSPLQLASPDFPDRVRSALRDSGLPPHVLMLELTESALMLSFAAGQRVLQALRDTGTKLALDDFGTGYSSLRRLRNLPVQELKIDKAFVEHLGHSSEDDAVAAGIVALAHSFGASTVAEGVETEQQARRLRELGCDLLQGFLFALPQPPGDAEAALIQLAERSRGLTGSTMATGGDPVAQASA